MLLVKKNLIERKLFFNSVLGNKMDTALDAEKIAVAADVFDPPSEEEEVDMESELESAMEDDVEETEETSDEVEAVDEVAEEEVA